MSSQMVLGWGCNSSMMLIVEWNSWVHFRSNTYSRYSCFSMLAVNWLKFKTVFSFFKNKLVGFTSFAGFNIQLSPWPNTLYSHLLWQIIHFYIAITDHFDCICFHQVQLYIFIFSVQGFWCHTWIKIYNTVGVTGEEYLYSSSFIDFYLLHHTHNSVSWTGFACKSFICDTKNVNHRLYLLWFWVCTKSIC
jgi:hypothetical protein